MHSSCCDTIYYVYSVCRVRTLITCVHSSYLADGFIDATGGPGLEHHQTKRLDWEPSYEHVPVLAHPFIVSKG